MSLPGIFSLAYFTAFYSTLYLDSIYFSVTKNLRYLGCFLPSALPYAYGPSLFLSSTQRQIMKQL